MTRSAIESIFDDWTGHLSQGFGVADDLRCCAQAAQDEGIERAAYLAEAVARGYSRSTASRCWSFVKE